MDKLVDVYSRLLRLVLMRAIVAQEEKIAQGDTAGALAFAREALTEVQDTAATCREDLVKVENDKLAQVLIIITLGYHRAEHNQQIASRRAMVEIADEVSNLASERVEELEKRFAVGAGKN